MTLQLIGEAHQKFLNYKVKELETGIMKLSLLKSSFLFKIINQKLKNLKNV